MADPRDGETGRRLAAAAGLAALLALALLVLVQPVAAQDLPTLSGPDRDTPALFSADSLTYVGSGRPGESEEEKLIAEGSVEVAQGDRILLADRLTYDVVRDLIVAEGSVSLVEPTGEVLFADRVELTGDLREGAIERLRVLLTDGSKLAGNTAVRSAGNATVLSKAVFSPCKLCEEDRERAPLWQIKAQRVTHDQVTKTIRYRNAFMEFFGIPVLYTPYLEHPDPTVKRKSGFLAPTIGNSDTLGATLQVPYFWAIAEDRDLTFQPIFTTEQSIVAAGRYRQLFPQGDLNVVGSATIADRTDSGGQLREDQLRGHLDATGRYDINEIWRAGAKVNVTTDDTYLRLYDFSSASSLTSRLYLEGFEDRSYAAANAFAYQGLREEDDQAETPIILPTLDYNYLGEADSWGGRSSVDLNILNLVRLSGRDTRRLAMNAGWASERIGRFGELLSLTASLEADGYWTSDLDSQSNEPNAQRSSDNGFAGRLYPQASAGLSYPLLRADDNFTQVISPMVQAVVSPRGMNPDDIPNEDSQDFEFDDTNLFSLNRFSGYDRVDSGPRLSYGLSYSVEGPSNLYANAFFGQSYRPFSNSLFEPGSGLEDNFSDLVGRVEILPYKTVDLLYRFRLDKEDLSPRRNELDFSAGPDWLHVNLGYLYIDDVAGETEFEEREEITAQLISRFSENWTGFVSHRRDLIADQSLQTQVGFTYQDECFLFRVVGERNFFEDREIEPEDSIYFQLVFKYLGELRSN